MSRRHALGDGDVCPINPEHGQMCFLTGDNQWCPSQTHDGVWLSSEKLPPTRSMWPKGHTSFRRAVIQTTLPEIDIQLIGG